MKEMKALQGAGVLTSTKAKERQYEELLSDLDNQVWKSNCQMTGKDICWKKKRAPPCEPKLNRDEFPAQNPTIFWLKFRHQQRCSALMIAESRGKEGNVPMRFEFLHDDRESLGKGVTILVQRI